MIVSGTTFRQTCLTTCGKLGGKWSRKVCLETSALQKRKGYSSSERRGSRLSERGLVESISDSGDVAGHGYRSFSGTTCNPVGKLGHFLSSNEPETRWKTQRLKPRWNLGPRVKFFVLFGVWETANSRQRCGCVSGRSSCQRCGLIVAR